MGIPSGSLLFAPSGQPCFFKDRDGNTITATGVTPPNGTSSSLGLAQNEEGTLVIVNNDGNADWYGSRLNLLTTVTGPFGAPVAGASWFVFAGGPGMVRYNSSGTPTNSYSGLTGLNGPGILYATRLETSVPNTVYTVKHVFADGDHIQALALSGAGTMSDVVNLSPDSGALTEAQGIAVLNSSTILVVTQSFSGQDWSVKRYTSAGTLLNTYTIITGDTSFLKYISAIVADPTDTSGFWISWYDGSVEHVQFIRISDGTVLKSWTMAAGLESNFIVLRVTIEDTATCIPAGSLMVSGYGDAGTFRFIHPTTGMILGQPPSAPVGGSGMAGVRRMAGNDICQVGGNAPNFPVSGAGVYNASDLTFRSELPGVTYVGGFCIACDADNKWYTARGDIVAGHEIFIAGKWDRDGTLLNHWSIDLHGVADSHGSPGQFAAATLWAAAVSPDGGTLYVWMGRGFLDSNKYRIRAFSLAGSGSYSHDLGNDYTGGGPGFNSLLCDDDGNIYAAFNSLNDASGASPGAFRKYAPDGSLLLDYSIPWVAGNGNAEWIEFGIANDVWLGGYDDDATTSSGSAHARFNATTGALLTGPWHLEEGGFEFDSPFTVLGQNVGTCTTPIITPTPVVVSSTGCCTDPDHPPTTVPGHVPPPASTAWESTCESGGVVPEEDDLVPAEVWDSLS